MASDENAPLDDLAGDPYHFKAGDIVVASEHLGLVTRQLDDARVEYAEPEESELLRLAKLTLSDPGQAASALAARLDDPAEIAKFDQREERSDLETTLACLRALIAGENGGWVPAMGKNRLVSRVRPNRVIWYSPGPMSQNRPQRVIWYGDQRPQRVIWYGDERPEDQAYERPTDRATSPGAGVRVGVLDSGIYAHPWLAGAWTAPIGDTIRGKDPDYLDGHGTFVTGLILSQAPGAIVRARKVLLGTEGTSDAWTVAEAIVDIGQSGIDILNLSFGCYTDDGQPPLVLATAIDRLDAEVVVVAAAGNHALIPPEEAGKAEAEKFASLPAWPAALDDVIAVGAVDKNGQRAPFSPAKGWVDIHTYGVELHSTYLRTAKSPDRKTDQGFIKGVVDDFGGWAEWSGTSFAAPLIAGAIAATMDRDDLSAQQAAAKVLKSVQDQPDPGESGVRFLPLKVW